MNTHLDLREQLERPGGLRDDDATSRPSTYDIPRIVRRMPSVELDDPGNEDTQIDCIADAIQVAA